MINLVWSGLLTLLLLSGCGFDGTPTRVNDFVPLTSIEIIAVPPTIAALTSTKLTAKGNFSGLFTRDITDQVVWSSASPAVAEFKFNTAPNKNRVTGTGPGTATLTATVGSVSASYSLTVSNAKVTSMAITPVAPVVPNGLTTPFTVKGSFNDGTTQDLTFDAAWASSDAAVATISNDPASKGLAKAIAAVGTATITATFDGVSGTTLLTATAAVVQSITVTSASTSVLSLSTANFKATGAYSDGSTQDITSQAVWDSSRKDFATITTSGGVATTLAQGTTSIIATLAGISGATNLKVTGGNLIGIGLPAGNITLVKGTVARLTVTGTFNNATNNTTRDITGLVVWSAANRALAEVNPQGGNLAFLNALEVTPAASPTTVTATIGTLNIPVNVTVTAPAPSFLSVTAPPATVPAQTAGTSARFTATATFNGGSTQDVTASATWTSSNTAIATVGDSGLEKGRVRGVAPGTATITATYGSLTIPASVTVTTRTLNSLTISGTTFVNSGNNVPFTATATYTDFIQNVTEDTTWSIDKPQVAILADSQNQPGQVVGVDSGSATLTASFGGKTPTVTVTVP